LIRAVVPTTDLENILDSISEQFQEEKVSPQDHGLLMKTFEDSLHTMRPTKKLSLLAKLLPDDVVESLPGDLNMLHLLIKSLTQDDAADFTHNNALLVKICKQLQTSGAISRFGASLSCINTILRTKPWLVSQHGIDTLLSTLANLASPKAQHLPKEHAPFVYLRLCQTTTNIVLLHRKTLGGRMHLLVLLLQNLMTCLFKSHRFQGRGFTTLLPPWLCNTPTPFTRSHSTAYTRLLSTLCSPTSSSTSSHRRHAELIDANKQAREYAGQYVPYILMHYCSLQLSGSMEAEVREGLRPGIWDMMGVVSIEGMRGMNVGMGRDERAVWGVVYAEWMRVGRGR
jgi:nucleolar pre-ribosomal-associated protein 2